MTCEEDIGTPAGPLSLDAAGFDGLFGNFPEAVLVFAEADLQCVAANDAASRHFAGGRAGLAQLSLDVLCSPQDLVRWMTVRAAGCDSGWMTWEWEPKAPGGMVRRMRFHARKVTWDGSPADLLVGTGAGNDAATDAACGPADLLRLAVCGLGRYSLERHRLLSSNPALDALMAAREADHDPLATAFLHTGDWAKFLASCARGETFEQSCVWRTGHAGRTHVCLRARPEETPRGIEVAFSVEDTGPQMNRVQNDQQSQRMEALGRMAGGVAHDFNNLLLIIRGHAEMIEEDLGANAELRRHTTRLLTAARQAAEITGTLLTFSRQEQQPPEAASLTAAVMEAVQLLPAVLPENIALDAQPDAHDVEILALPAHIEQVILNLAMNARDAMPSGGRLGIRCGWEPGAPGTPGFARIEVSDTGIGMDAETRAHIFEPFYTTKARGRGTGLGLALVYGIVSQYDGTIEVDSDLGRGTTFTVRMPALTAPAASPAKKPAASESAPVSTVLLVDDEPEIRQMVDDFLTRLGYRVLQAADARAALLHAGQLGPEIDLLLTDVVMPDTDGFELALMMREQLPDLPVIVMSGFTGGAMARKGKSLGQVPLLSKPFSLRQLEACVKSVIEQPRASRAGKEKPRSLEACAAS